MTWPRWIDDLRDRYLADEGNVFLLHGEVGSTWTIDGETVGLVDVLVRFLHRTRQVIGVLRPGSPLAFPHFEDSGRFERLLSARELVTGRRLGREGVRPEDQLGLIWAALGGTGFDQAWILEHAHAMFPGHRTRVDPLGAGAPPLAAWAEHLRTTNHLVVLLAPETAALRAEIAASAVHVPVSTPDRSPSRSASDPRTRTDAEAEIEAFLASRGPAAQAEPAPVTPAAPPERAEVLGADLVATLQDTISVYPTDTWAARLPVMDAVARVLAAHGAHPGPLTFSVDEDGRAVAQGDGAETFMARWRADIAMDAAAGMLLKEVPVPDGSDRVFGPLPWNETAIRALARRVARLLP